MKIITILLYRLIAITGSLKLLLFILLALSFSFYIAHSTTHNTAPRSLEIALVDLDESNLSKQLITKLTALDGLDTRQVNLDTAQMLLARGRIEGIFIIEPGYAYAIQQAFGRELPIRYESSTFVDSKTAVREMIAGQVISQRSFLRAEAELIDAGIEFSPAKLEELMRQFNEETNPLYTFSIYAPTTLAVTSDENHQIPRDGFTTTHVLSTTYLGFVSLAIILVLMTLSQWFAQPDSKAVANRMLILPKGRALSFFTDTLLLFVIGTIIILLASLLPFSISKTQFLYLFAYLYCITGLCLILSRFQESGSINILAPLIALFTSILGGSFMDLSTLSTTMQFLSLLTPQGQMLHGINHSTFLNLAVLLATGTTLLIATYCIGSPYIKGANK